ncbi:MAG: hypothetical protein M0019_01630 [Actinomycetota bacterium]|nr:hypothetical protein [Actinomycetota bacterium]
MLKSLVSKAGRLAKFVLGARASELGRGELAAIARRYSPVIRNISIALFIFRKVKGWAAPKSTKVKVSPGESVLIVNKLRQK